MLVHPVSHGYLQRGYVQRRPKWAAFRFGVQGVICDLTFGVFKREHDGSLLDFEFLSHINLGGLQVVPLLYIADRYTVFLCNHT